MPPGAQQLQGTDAIARFETELHAPGFFKKTFHRLTDERIIIHHQTLQSGHGTAMKR